MMVNCPKCGFSQPKDRYCASCGIDMVTFRPAQKPFATRIVQSTALQVVTLGLVVAGVAVYVRDQNRAELSKQLSNDQQIASKIAESQNLQEESEAARVAANDYAQQQAVEREERERSNAQSNAQLNAQNFASQTTQSADALPVAAAAASASPSPSPSASPQAAAGAAGTAAGAAGELAKSLSIYFVEVPRGQINDLLAQSRQNGGDGISNFGVVREAQKSFALIRNFRKVEAATDQPIRLNQPNVTFKGTHDVASGQNFGINVQAVPVSSDENGIRFQIDANRVLRDPNA
ncbi:MAG: hypothetical protein EOP05_01915, partial [Proteobacteria bacterium]